MKGRNKHRKVNSAFIRWAPDREPPPEVLHSAFRTKGTLIGEVIVNAFRYRRTAFLGAELPGKVMLEPPLLPCYRQSSSL